MQNGRPPPQEYVNEAEYHRSLVRDYWMSTVQARLPILGTHIPNVNVIDDHIDGLEHALAYARYMRNLSLPALRLPPELLALVFLDLFEDWPSARTRFPSGLDVGQEEPRSRFVYQLNWISAALHVCHMWRNQLLLCPSLWSYVDTAVIPPRLAPWFIDLSRTAPLRLGLELSRPHEQFSSFEILRSVLLPQQLPRLFALGLNLCDLSIVPALTTAILPAHMPYLTFLSIGIAPDLIPTGKEVIYLPVAWLAKFAPNVGELRLHQCALTWPASGEAITMPRLKTFEYSIKNAAIYTSPRATLTLTQMQAFWMSMPLLEEVHLFNPAPFVQNPQTPASHNLYNIHSEPVIDMPNSLKHLVLSSFYAPIAPLASLLRIPVDTRAELTTAEPDDFSALPLRRFCGVDRPPRTLLFSLSTSKDWTHSSKDWEYIILAWASSPGSAEWTPTSAEEPSLHVRGDWTDRHGQSTNPLSEMDLSELRVLVLTGESDMKVTDMRSSESFYRKATRLQRLEVADWKVAIAFIRALVPKPGSDGDCLFPELEDICVGISTDIGDQGHERDEDLKMPPSSDLIRIVSCLAARAARGCPLRKLCLPSHLENSGEWLDRVKETGVQVAFV